MFFFYWLFRSICAEEITNSYAAAELHVSQFQYSIHLNTNPVSHYPCIKKESVNSM